MDESLVPAMPIHNQAPRTIADCPRGSVPRFSPEVQSAINPPLSPFIDRQYRLSVSPSQPTLQMNRLHRALEPAPTHHNRDRQLTRPLRDRDNIDVLLRNRRKDAPRQPRRTLHSFAHHSDQPDVFINVERLKIPMRQFERQALLQMIGHSSQLALSNQEAKCLPI